MRRFITCLAVLVAIYEVAAIFQLANREATKAENLNVPLHNHFWRMVAEKEPTTPGDLGRFASELQNLIATKTIPVASNTSTGYNDKILYPHLPDAIRQECFISRSRNEEWSDTCFTDSAMTDMVLISNGEIAEALQCEQAIPAPWFSTVGYAIVKTYDHPIGALLLFTTGCLLTFGRQRKRRARSQHQNVDPEHLTAARTELDESLAKSVTPEN